MDTPDAEGRPHLLAIDDDEINLMLIASVLSSYRLTTFSGPLEALAALRDGLRPDLIVCDVTMPGMTGFELHAHLRDIAALRSVPFIYLTALDQAEDVRTGMGLGADDYLTKPYTPDELRTAVQTRLGRVEGLREAARREWRVVTLGGLDVRHGDERVAWESRRAVELFLLLLAGDREAGTPVAEVRSELWWQAPSGNQLHALTSRLRKALGEGAGVESDGSTMRLVGVESVAWDVPAFERAAREALLSHEAGAIEGAIAAYRGPFLPDGEGPWVERTRARLEDLAIELLEAAIEVSDGAARERAEARLEGFFEA